MGKRYVVRLSVAERELANQLANDPATPTRVRLWASVLLAADVGQRDQDIATQLRTSVATVQRTRRRYVHEGFDAAIGWEKAAPAVTNKPSLERTWASRVLRCSLGISGVTAAAIVDYESGVCVWQKGTDAQLVMAVSDNAALVRAKLDTIRRQQLNEALEDIVITTPLQYHLIRMVSRVHKVFLNIVLDRQCGNLGLAYHQMEALEQGLAD